MRDRSTGACGHVLDLGYISLFLFSSLNVSTDNGKKRNCCLVFVNGRMRNEGRARVGMYGWREEDESRERHVSWIYIQLSSAMESSFSVAGSSTIVLQIWEKKLVSFNGHSWLVFKSDPLPLDNYYLTPKLSDLQNRITDLSNWPLIFQWCNCNPK